MQDLLLSQDHNQKPIIVLRRKPRVSHNDYFSLDDSQILHPDPIIICSDNKCVMPIASNHVFHSRNNLRWIVTLYMTKFKLESFICCTFPLLSM